MGLASFYELGKTTSCTIMLKLIGCNSNDIVHCNVSAYCKIAASFIAGLRIRVVLAKRHRHYNIEAYSCNGASLAVYSGSISKTVISKLIAVTCKVHHSLSGCVFRLYYTMYWVLRPFMNLARNDMHCNVDTFILHLHLYSSTLHLEMKFCCR